MRATFRKHERLTGRDRLKRVATTGHVMREHPFRLSGVVFPPDGPFPTPAQVAFAVPKRHVPSAVDRNRVRRHMREAYRLNKHRWHGQLDRAQVRCEWLVSFHGDAPVGWEATSRILINLFDRWIQRHVGTGQ